MAASSLSVAAGEPVTLTAGFAPGSTARRATFFDRATILGTVPVSGDGRATFSIALPAGRHSLYAVMIGGGRSHTVDLEVKGGGPGWFAAPKVYRAGFAPRTLASADFNRDGRADIVTAGAGTVSVLLGNGDGSFAAPLATTAAIEPAALAVGDFDGDGLPDVAVADSVTGKIQILLGAGDGTFRESGTATVATGPSAMAVGDFNGDGMPDLAVADRAGNVVWVLIGRGDGSFRAPVSLVAGAAPNGVAVGDFNGDGNADLAVANSGSDTLTIFAGSGDGTFGPGAAFSTGAGLSAITAGDLDGDGADDIAAFSRRDGSIAVIYGGKDGKYQRRSTLAAGTSAMAMALGETAASGSRALLTVDGARVQSREAVTGSSAFSTAYPGGAEPGIAVADFNGDGRLDIAATGSNGIIILAAAATHLVIIIPPTVQAGVPFDMTVEARDGANLIDTTFTGNIQFISTDGAGVLPGTFPLINGTRTYTGLTILKTIGPQTIRATDTITSFFVDGDTLVTPGPATHFAFTLPSPVTAGVPFTGVELRALDQFNNTATGYTGTVQFTSNDTAALMPGNYTFTVGDAGVHAFAFTMKTAGLKSIQASDGSISVMASTTVNPGPVTHFGIVAPASATAGTAFVFTVTALDQFGNTATGYAGTIHFTSSDGQATLPPNSALGGGSFSATLKTAGNQTITGTDAAIMGTSNNIAVNAMAATHFAVSAPASATAGNPFSLTVTALDQFNNTATGYGGTIHFTSSDGQATLPANSMLGSGVGAFSATLKTAGNRTITATDAAIMGTSNNIAVSATAATHFAVSAPASATAGNAFGLTVTALDQFNNTATAYAGIVHFTSSDGQAILPANSTLTNGVGTFPATLKTAGNQTITATDTVTAATTGTSNTIAVNGLTVTHHFGVQAPATATSGSAFNFTVTAQDQFNNTVTGYSGTVHFSTGDPLGAVPFNSTLVNGIGTFSANLKTVGSQTLTATDTVTASITGTAAIFVNAASASKVNPQVTPTNIFLQYFQGTDPLLVGASFTISSDTGIGFSIAPAPPSWLLLSTLTGIVTPTTVNIKINPTGLAVGTYTTTETVIFADGTQIAVNITLQVVGLPRISTDLTGTSLVFTAVAGSTTVQSQDVKIFSSIRGITAQAAAGGGTWLSANPSSGSTPFILHVQVNPTGLAVGSYPGTITLTSTSADNNPFTIPVTFNIVPGQVISIGAFVNAASMLPNSAAPNTIMTVFGTFPNCSTGAQVMVNGGSVLVFFSSPTQINFLLPESLGAVRTASIQVSCAGLTSQTTSLTLTDYAPAIFTLGQNGKGQGAIINQDHTIETPSPKNSIMEVYATGFGVLVKGSDGLGRSTLPVTAFVGDVPATVTYAGEAPTWPGLQQINVQIPAGAPSGAAVSLRLVINGISTQTGVTIAIP